jgi:hypothetical protein
LQLARTLGIRWLGPGSGVRARARPQVWLRVGVWLRLRVGVWLRVGVRLRVRVGVWVGSVCTHASPRPGEDKDRDKDRDEDRDEDPDDK